MTTTKLSRLFNLFLVVVATFAIVAARGFASETTLREPLAQAAQMQSVPRLSTRQLEEENEPLRRVLHDSPSNPHQFEGKRLAILTTDGVESIELSANRDYFRKRGAVVDIVAPRLPKIDRRLGVQYPLEREHNILTVRYMENADWVKIDRFTDEAENFDYDAVIIAGGAWNPDSLRIDPGTLSFVRTMADKGKVIAAICHGPLVLINAGLLVGKNATSTWNVQEDLKNAGARVSDVPVVVDGKIITSRHPIDLPQFLQAIGEALHTRGGSAAHAVQPPVRKNG
ncbi:MAG: type 1 glutamine amidotransferase [Bdellovibrio sp.]|nr:MAG: type 1 glutamine amidotransferase [Bdellovibrio sp.]